MRIIRTTAAVAVACCLCACGGGGDSANVAPGATTYSFVEPTLGAHDTFTTTTIDDENNTITGTYEETVASVNPDGSYTIAQDDPTGSNVVVDGISYRFDPRVLSFDGSGHETTDVVDEPTGTVTCTLATQSGGHPFPWAVGQSWTDTQQQICSNGSSLTFTVAGQVASYESVTVAAGTFMALKSVSTETWTDANGQHVVGTITHWSDPAHFLFTLKSTESYVRSGNVPAHHVLSHAIELASRGP